MCVVQKRDKENLQKQTKKLHNLKEQASIIWSNTFKSQRNSENEGKKLMQSVDTGFIFIVLSLQALVACKDHSCSFAEASRHRGHCSASVGSCEWWQIEWNWLDDLSPAWSIRDTCVRVCVCVSVCVCVLGRVAVRVWRIHCDDEPYWFGVSAPNEWVRLIWTLV